MIAALLHDISAILSPDDIYKYAKELGYQIDPSEENIISYCIKEFLKK